MQIHSQDLKERHLRLAHRQDDFTSRRKGRPRRPLQSENGLPMAHYDKHLCCLAASPPLKGLAEADRRWGDQGWLSRLADAFRVAAYRGRLGERALRFAGGAGAR